MNLKDVLSLLAERIQPPSTTDKPRQAVVVGYSHVLPAVGHEPTPSSMVTNDHFWRCLEKFLRPSDILLGETGNSFFGALACRLKPGCTIIQQGLWCSIGYCLPASFGASVAVTPHHDDNDDSSYPSLPSQRVILVTGDGSAQMTAQELSTICR